MKKTINLLSKTPFFILFVLLLGCTSSCTNRNEPVEPLQVTFENNLSEIDEYQLFIASVDSLNCLYPSLETKGSFLGGAGTNMADYVGYTCGGSIGKWIGGAIGCLAGNPVVAVAGVLIGDRAGKIVCGAFASGLINMLLSCQAINKSHDELQFKYNFSFENSLEESIDSLGYYHNLCMVQILSQKEKYNYGKEINKELLYDDIIGFYKSHGIYDETLENNPDVKEAIITVTTDLCEPSIQYELEKISEDELINSYEGLLKEKFKCNNDELVRFKDFGSKLVLKCASLKEEELKNYASDINNLIKNSSLPNSEKLELSSSSDLIINSSLCWQQ